jgi:nucleoside-diphosphate-sugar epimerase
MVKIIVTGGSGFIGTNLIDFYLKKEIKVNILNLDLVKPKVERQYDYWVKCDICDLELTKKYVTDFNPHYIINLAGKTDFEGKNIEDYSVNTTGVSNVIKLSEYSKDLKRIIFASSRLVCNIHYEPKDFDDYAPYHLYGESKMIGEKLVKNSQINCEWLIVRPTSIWGPFFEIPYKIFFNTVLKNRYFHPGKHDPLKSYGFVGNTVYQLNELLVSNEIINRSTLYLCDYPPISVKVWAELIQANSTKKTILTIPFWILTVFSKVGDVLLKMGWKSVPLTSFRLDNLITNMVYNTESLKQICGDKLPYTLEQGVKETLKYLTHKKHNEK